jgi:hypothetical protein
MTGARTREQDQPRVHCRDCRWLGTRSRAIPLCEHWNSLCLTRDASGVLWSVYTAAATRNQWQDCPDYQPLTLAHGLRYWRMVTYRIVSYWRGWGYD